MSKNKYFKSSLFIAALMLFVLSPTFLSAEDNFKKGLMLFKEYKYDEAEKLLLAEIKKNPKNAEALFALGKMKLDRGDYDAAITYFSKTIKANTKHAEAYIWRAYSREHKGFFENAVDESLRKALLDTEKAVKASPESALAYSMRGRVKGRMKKVKDAMADHNKALRLDPKNAWVYCNIAASKQTADERLKFYNKAIKIKPKSEIGYYYRGHAKNELKDYKGALADFNKTIELNPYYFWGIVNKASLHIKGLQKSDKNKQK